MKFLLWLFLALPLVARAGSPASDSAAETLDSALALLARHEAQLARVQEPAAEMAERLLSGGRLWLDGDPAWVAEADGRAGGLGGTAVLRDLSAIKAGDVVWLGDQGTDPRALAERWQALAAKKAWVVIFGPERPVDSSSGVWIDPLAPQPQGHAVLLGNVLSLWETVAELAASTARRGRTLVFLESHSIDAGRDRNALYRGQLFHDRIPQMTPMPPGELSRAYVQALRRRVETLRPGPLAALERLGADLAEHAAQGERPALMSLSHMMPLAIPPETPFYRAVSLADHRAHLETLLKPGGLLVFLGYVGVPLDIWHGVRRAHASAAWIVAPLTNQVDFAQFGDRVIAQPWEVGDACVRVPGYDTAILPPSGFLQLLMFDCLMAAANNPSVHAPQARIEASPTRALIKIDGRLDEAAWAAAKVYALSPVPGADKSRGPLRETGTARLLWDEGALYVGLELRDSDIVARGDVDGLYHYRLGDVAEVFLQPTGQPWYWEFYVTPRGKQSTFYYPSRAYLGLPSTLAATNELTVAAQIQGPLDRSGEESRGWTAEMAIPKALLTRQGDRFGPGGHWRLQVGRYNYSADLSALELSSLPILSQANFHLTEEFLPLEFLETK